jgi:hypothetical protein
MSAEIRVSRIIILFQGMSILFMVWLTTRLGLSVDIRSTRGNDVENHLDAVNG